MKVLLIRHGESSNTRVQKDNPESYASLRNPDADLTPAGIEQTR
jgi:broad specificity phosphatase PhoE